MLAIFDYYAYAGIMPNAILPPQNYAGMIGSSQSLSLSFTYYSFQNFLKFLRTTLITYYSYGFL